MKGPRTSAGPSARSRSWVKVEGGPVLACIDMGTNSFHMIVCKANEARDHFDVIIRAKEAVPFFRRALTEHFIDESAARAAIRILRDMKHSAIEKGATTIMAVATSAVRESKNGVEILSRIRDELGVDARMISGHEEARLIYLGVLWSMPELKGTFAIVDVGGGSTEIIVGDRNHTTFAESYKLGAARLTQRFFRKGQPTSDTIEELHDEVRGMLRPAAAAVRTSGGFGQLIGTSGTVLALAKLDRLRHGKQQAELKGWKISFESLVEIVSFIDECSLKGRKIEGISSDRSQTIMAGSIVLLETMRSLGAADVQVCTAALREGVVVDRFLQTGWLTAGLEHHRDPRSDSVHELLHKYQASTPHAEQVARIAAEIFQQTSGVLHDYPENVGHLLWSAGMLHDVGTFIGRNGHHKHSYYLIKNGGLLGHSEEEVELIACIARYHRGSDPKESHIPFSALRSSDRKLVSDMAAILRIAEALDRSHRQVVESLRVIVAAEPKNKQGARSLIIEASLRAGESCQPEIWAVTEKQALFEKQLQVDLILQINSREPQGLVATDVSALPIP